MNKKSYLASKTDKVEVKGPSADLVNKETATETGARGFGTTEMTYYYDQTDPDIYEEESEESSEGRPLGQDVIDMLVELGDGLDVQNEKVLAGFADFLISKFAQAKDSNIDYSIMFNKIITRVISAEYLSNRNEICKKLAKIYSRTLVLEYNQSGNLDSSKKSAYKKTLHRAEQYLSED